MLETNDKIWVRETATISRWWKWSQIVIYIIATVSGIGAAIIFGEVDNAFLNNCILNTDAPWLINGTEITLSTLVRFKWAPKSKCSIALYSPIVTTVYGIVMAWFYAMCKGGGRKGQEKPWKIVLPSFILTVLLMIFTFSGAYILSSGIRKFCTSIENHLDLSCSDAQFYHWREFPNAQGFYSQLIVTQLFSWICFFCWLLSSAITFYRCFVAADFEFMGSEPEREIMTSGQSSTSKMTLTPGSEGFEEAQQMLGSSDDEKSEFRSIASAKKD